jgi:hypothetical protein
MFWKVPSSQNLAASHVLEGTFQPKSRSQPRWKVPSGQNPAASQPANKSVEGTFPWLVPRDAKRYHKVHSTAKNGQKVHSTAKMPKNGQKDPKGTFYGQNDDKVRTAAKTLRSGVRGFVADPYGFPLSVVISQKVLLVL